MNSKNPLQTLTLIYFMLLSGIILLTVIFIFIPLGPVSGLDSILRYLVPAIALLSYLIGFFVAKQQIKNINPADPLKYKISKYTSANIIRFASIEGGSLFAIVAYGLTGNTYYLIFLAILIVVYILFRPSTARIIDELNLDSGEIQQLKTGEI